jgi:hypothetical protein
MARTSRRRFLLALVDDLMSPSHLIRNPFLCSRLNSCNRLPLSAIAESPNLQKLNATEAELIDCCRRSQLVDLVGITEVALRYDIRPQILILTQAATIASAFEVRDFIHQIKGDFQFRAFPTADGGDIAIHFDSLEQCIAVWRTLQLVPYRGHALDIQVYWPSVAEFEILHDVTAANPTPVFATVPFPVIEPKSMSRGQYLPLAILRGIPATVNVT